MTVLTFLYKDYSNQARERAETNNYTVAHKTRGGEGRHRQFCFLVLSATQTVSILPFFKICMHHCLCTYTPASLHDLLYSGTEASGLVQLDGRVQEQAVR